jgi:zinc/manganese transport system substrate-binding protein
VREVSRYVASELIAAKPAASAAIERRLHTWLDQLASLEAWAKAEVTRVPPERRLLVTSHGAFGWLARDLGFAVHPIKGGSADAEPSGRQMAELVDLIREHELAAVFAENVENPRLLNALVAETGARLGGTLYADGPGAPGSGVETYAAMYRHNVSTIVAGLLGR